ncbi:MAG: hypothetical protein AB1700_08180 [Bacillota bacterium]
MNGEALRNVRGMRQVKGGLDLARSRKPPTTNNMFKSEEEMTCRVAVNPAELARALVKERRRIAKYRASVERSRERLLAAREKLRGIIQKNEAITRLRLGGQSSGYADDRAPAVKGRVKRCWDEKRVRELTY